MKNFQTTALSSTEQTSILGGHRGGHRGGFGGGHRGGFGGFNLFGITSTTTKPTALTEAETAFKTANDAARTELKTNGTLSDATKTTLKTTQLALMQAKLDWLKTL